VTVAVPRNDLGVEGDPVRLAQVVFHLLTNASTSSDRGGHIHLSAAREGGHVVMRVRDSGAGIAPALLPRVFDLFAQAPQALARTQGGLGLGLSIVRRLVMLHGGQVEANSEGPGRGSEFVVRLPAAREAVPVAAAAAPTTKIPRAARRLLLVDDNRDAADILAEGLALVGYEVRVAHDGPTALAVAAAFRPALVLLDIGLPVMDGYEVAQRMRQQFSQMRLVALTGYGQDRDRAHAQAAGFDEHLVKPVRLDRLITVLARLHDRIDAS
jgi:CheY-like chemotaxis protein